jgi:hypothetical protein
MSFKRHCVLLRRYSVSPFRYARRVTVTSLKVEREKAVLVVYGERDLRHAHRFTSAGPGEDHIGGFRGAERGGLLLAQNPEQGVEKVRLAGTVRTDNRRDARRERNLRFIRESFKAV